MFQRALLRQSQAVKSVLSSTRTSTAPLAVRQTSRLQPQLLRPLAYQPAYRFYSTEKEGGENEKDSEAAAKQETPEDPLRKELEEKKKEASELKACTRMSMVLQSANCETG